MKLPATQRRKALIIIDVQPAFLRPHSQPIISSITQLLNHVTYDLYVEAIFYAQKGSLWDTQQDWICPQGKDTCTVAEISAALQGRNVLTVMKSTRSVFGGDQDLKARFVQEGIAEVHLVGIETNDCVLATAFDAFDAGYPTYVLEECCESQEHADHELGLKLLRRQSMTNHSCLAETTDVLFSH